VRYLLDTNIVSNLIREPGGRIADRIVEVGERQVCTSIVVAAELRYGAAMRGSSRLTSQVEAILNTLEALPLESPADEAYGLIRLQLESKGTPIGGNDLLIAAQALSLNYIVVTDNEGEFGRVRGLRTENWLKN
jgi:tRNA(fMet)-specific endonuclease VapC